MKLDPDALSALREILLRGSFDAAAAALGVTPSAISQRIKALEDQAGGALVVRGQPCTATPLGARLGQHANAVALLEAELARDLDRAVRPAQVSLAINADSLGTWFPEALAATTGLLFALEVDDQDHSAEWLRSGAVVAAVTARAQPVQGCDCHALGALRYVPTASPAFVARWFPDGLTAQALAQAPMLQFNPKDRLQLTWLAQMTGQRLHPPTHLIPSTHGFVDAALGGLAWGMNPDALVRDHLAAGRLIALDPTPFDTPLYWQVARHVARPLGPLTQAVRKVARQRLIPPPRAA